MTDLVLHKAEKYIQEDLDYYFSNKRDIHDQVRPKESIYSLTPESQHLNINFNDGKVGNLFFPFAPFSLDRIYIGISFPLFSNNWGASFLRYLLTRVKATGCVILPVYPEMQAIEKNYWSRSLLENIFLSRSRWLGTSNLWAENDGVMSLRVGRKWPPKILSTAKYLFSQSGYVLLRQMMLNKLNDSTLMENFIRLHKSHWQNVSTSAVFEKIIQDHFSMKETVRLCNIGADSLLSIECLLSSYINVQKVVCFISNTESLTDHNFIIEHFNQQIHGRLILKDSAQHALEVNETFHIISFINYSSDESTTERLKMLDKAWQKLKRNGLLVIYETSHDISQQVEFYFPEETLSKYGAVNYYSTIVASKLSDDKEITHYSSILETELKEEFKNKKSLFRVIQKQ